MPWAAGWESLWLTYTVPLQTTITNWPKLARLSNEA